MTGIGGQAGKVVTVQTEMPEDIDGILEAVRKIILLGRVKNDAMRWTM